jgi:uncharacterized protein (DUF1499 family)
MNDPANLPVAASAGPRLLAAVALAVGIAAILMVGGAGPGTRFGLWSYITGLRTVLKYGAYLGVLTLILSVIALLVARRSGRGVLAMALVALLLGLVSWYLPWSWRRTASGKPPIHDITTDFTNPPPLTFSRMLRDTSGGRLNAWQYEGDSIARQQQRAYPDVRPLLLAMTPDEAYRAAMGAARKMGWEITVNDPTGRTLEAVDQTRWFGFKDDVVVRVTPASGIARVDVRSVSRVGRGDVGLNAERIRRYLARLREDNRDRLGESN